MSSLYKAIRDRRSVSRYLSSDVPDDVLQRVLDAARWAPSAHNAQPWRFVVIKDSIIKPKLAETMASEWNRDLRGNGVSLERRERRLKFSVEKSTQAPVLIVAFLTMEEMDKYPDEERQKAEYVMSVHSVAAAIQNMLLAAHTEELGGCWFCAPLFCAKAVEEILEAPDGVEPQALITLGYPAERPEPPPRKSLEAIVYRDLWGRRE